MTQEIQTILKSSLLPNGLDEIFGKIKNKSVGISGTSYWKYVQCGKKGCHCAHDKGHGPYLYVKTSRGDKYIGKVTPENFHINRYIHKEAERLIQLYGKILLADSDLTKMIRDFVLGVDSILEKEDL